MISFLSVRKISTRMDLTKIGPSAGSIGMRIERSSAQSKEGLFCHGELDFIRLYEPALE